MRDTLPVGDVEELEDTSSNKQSKDDGCADHHSLLVLLFDKAVLLLGFLLFSKPLHAFVDDRLPCALTEAEADQSGDLLPMFGGKFGVDGFSGY